MTSSRVHPWKIRRSWKAALSAAIALASAPTPARADPTRAENEIEAPRPPPAYRLDPAIDLSIVVIAGATASTFFFADQWGSPPSCAPLCDGSHLNFLDRPAAGLYDRRWSNIGDIATASTLALPPLVVLLDEGTKNGLNDDLVLLEAGLVSSAIQVSTAYAVPRPRPRVYGERAPLSERTDAIAARSFYSGHVANAMAVSVAGLRTFQRLDKPVVGWLVLGAGVAGSGVIGVSRVLGGSHFPTDVLFGAVTGTGIGLVMPAVHGSNVRVVPLGAASGSGVAMLGAW